MCGRYTQATELQRLIARFETRSAPDALRPSYNVAPGQPGAVVVADGARTLALMKWGLVPRWAKEESIGYKMINARGETVSEKPSFRDAYAKRRCLVVADGFYEWKKEGKVKIPHRFVLKDREPFAFAGLWECWKRPDGAELRSYAIITTRANATVAPVHERMPVILSRSDEETWLSPDAPRKEVDALIRSYPEEEMEVYPVSTRVNSPKNNDPECMRPAG